MANIRENKARLKWACRRGMLELDVLLAPFIDKETGFDALSAEDQQVFERLLTCSDPELFAWFMGHETCTDPDLARVIHAITRHNLEQRPA